MYITGAFYFYFDLGLELNFYTKIYKGNYNNTNDDIIFLTHCSSHDSQQFCISNFASIRTNENLKKYRSKNRFSNVQKSVEMCLNVQNSFFDMTTLFGKKKQSILSLYFV